MFNFLGFALRAWYKKKLSHTSCCLSALVSTFIRQNITATMKAILVIFLSLQLVILNEGLRKFRLTKLRNCPPSQEFLALKKALRLKTEMSRFFSIFIEPTCWPNSQVSKYLVSGHCMNEQNSSQKSSLDVKWNIWHLLARYTYGWILKSYVR